MTVLVLHCHLMVYCNFRQVHGFQETRRGLLPTVAAKIGMLP